MSEYYHPLYISNEQPIQTLPGDALPLFLFGPPRDIHHLPTQLCVVTDTCMDCRMDQ
jgi:hypothetical protein